MASLTKETTVSTTEQTSTNILYGLEVVVALSMYQDDRRIVSLDNKNDNSGGYVHRVAPPTEPRGLWDKAYFDSGKFANLNLPDVD